MCWWVGGLRGGDDVCDQLDVSLCLFMHRFYMGAVRFGKGEMPSSMCSGGTPLRSATIFGKSLSVEKSKNERFAMKGSKS